MADTNVAFMAKPNNKIGVAHGNYVMRMHTAIAFLGTGADVNVIDSALVPTGRKNSLKREALPRLQMTT